MYSGQAFLGLGVGQPGHGQQQQLSPLARSASLSHPTPFPMAYSVATPLHALSPFRQHSPGRSTHQSRSSSPGGHLVSTATFPTMDSFSAQLRTGFDPLHSLPYRFPYSPTSTPMDAYASAFRPIASLSALWSPSLSVAQPQHGIERPSALSTSLLHSARGGLVAASASAAHTPMLAFERPTKIQSSARSDPTSSSSSDSLVQTLKTFLLPQRSSAPSERSSSAASDAGQLDKAMAQRSSVASDANNQAGRSK
uniref:Uncharacterized protein n=1 Tax=Plectus sambesii TaxID=2011161 RepID=A0A914V6H0_9BILA